MNYIKYLAALVAAFLLSGCAGMYEKPQMDPQTRLEATRMIAAMVHCYENGYLDPADMALGKQVLHNRLSYYSDSIEEIFQASKVYTQEEVLPHCKAVKALFVDQHKLNAMRPAPTYAPTPQQPTVLPSRTVCNQIGFQTMCSTY